MCFYFFMKAILKYVGIFLGICIVVMCILELLLRQIPNDYKTKATTIKLNGDDIETLILGSSHTFYGINPNLLTNAYNLAHSSKSYDLDWKILKKNEKYLPHLKTIIISSSYFSYVHLLGESSQQHLLKDYRLYYGIDINKNKLSLNTEIFSLPISTNYLRLKNWIITGKNDVTIDDKGYIEKRRNQNLKKYYSTAIVKKHTLPLDTVTINQNLSGLKSILNFAKQHHINVIFVTTPVAPNYIKNVNREQLLHWQKITNEFVKNDSTVIWLDFFKQSNQFKVSDFVDADHLSLQGANKVTKEVAKYIK